MVERGLASRSGGRWVDRRRWRRGRRRTQAEDGQPRKAHVGSVGPVTAWMPGHRRSCSYIDLLASTLDLDVEVDLVSDHAKRRLHPKSLRLTEVRALKPTTWLLSQGFSPSRLKTTSTSSVGSRRRSSGRRGSCRSCRRSCKLLADEGDVWKLGCVEPVGALDVPVPLRVVCRDARHFHRHVERAGLRLGRVELERTGEIVDGPDDL